MRAAQTETWIDGKFEADVNPKDGLAVSDCIDPREKRVLEFVVSILYPEKPNRVTKEVGNTIFGALSGQYKVSWLQVIYEVVDKLISVLGKRKPTPISPYMFHLYSKFECLRKKEMEELEVAKECFELGVAPEEEPEAKDDLDQRSLSPKPKTKASTASPRPRLKTTSKSPREKDPVRSPDCKELSFLEQGKGPFCWVQEELSHVENHYSKLETVVKNASRLLGDCKASNIGKEILKLKQEDSAELKTYVTHLKLRICTLQDMVKAQDEEINWLKERWQSMEKIRSIMEYTGDIAAKAHLFDNDVKTEEHLS